jgi:cytochrome c oxidase subunit 4
MGIKFFVVASQFMHLKFDNRILSRIFYTGLFLAVFVYVIALTTFRIWNF